MPESHKVLLASTSTKELSRSGRRWGPWLRIHRQRQRLTAQAEADISTSAIIDDGVLRVAAGSMINGGRTDTAQHDLFEDEAPSIDDQQC